MNNQPKVWSCKIGGFSGDLNPGSDAPMRQAVAEAYRRITGQDADFHFSGWGDSLTEPEQEVVEEQSRNACDVKYAATHRCKMCGALWRLNPAMSADEHKSRHCSSIVCPLLNDSWSVVTPEIMGKCCDNAPMGEQIESILEHGHAEREARLKALGFTDEKSPDSIGCLVFKSE